MDGESHNGAALEGVITAVLLSSFFWLALVALLYVTCTDRADTPHHGGGAIIQAPFDWRI